VKTAMVAGALMIVCAQLVGVSSAFADPPSPPPPPPCKYCDGPPLPPTIVPTVAPTQIPQAATVDVHLAPTHVSRGKTAKIAVTAEQDAKVIITVQYHGQKKRSSVHTQIGDTGMLVKAWKVPKSAPLGKAKVTVAVSTQDHRFALQLTITK
jgi:hypothetical protein